MTVLEVIVVLTVALPTDTLPFAVIAAAKIVLLEVTSLELTSPLITEILPTFTVNEAPFSVNALLTVRVFDIITVFAKVIVFANVACVVAKIGVAPRAVVTSAEVKVTAPDRVLKVVTPVAAAAILAAAVTRPLASTVTDA